MFKAPVIAARPVLKKPPLPEMTPYAPAPSSAPKGFDRATETKLRRGKLALEARLDLHGMTQAEAFAALHRFIHDAVAEGKRTVLVITGKGGVTSGGVLKRMLPLWLEDPSLKKHLIALAPAHPKDGGAGAFYLRLRKAR
jgi:DNA-nicking Smr family endonuclease